MWPLSHRTARRLLAGAMLGAGLPAIAADAYEALRAEARRDCVKAAAVYPPLDQPSGSARPCGHGQPSDFYYGLGRPVDDAQARLCAYAELDYGVLAMLYANGRGVARDYGVARKAVCDDTNAAPMETQGRLERLARMESSAAHQAESFDVCDDATSGAMTGWCAELAARRKAPPRDARLAALSASWPAAQQAAFERLRQAHQAFVDARGGEVDRRGTLRDALATDEKERERDAFAELVARAEAGRVVAGAPAQARAQDERLNATWARLKAAPDDTDPAAVTMAGILAAQRAWLKYRDAWVRFAALRYPALPAPTWVALLTAQRDQELEALLWERAH